MAIKTIVQIGDSRLQIAAQKVIEFNTAALDNLVADLAETMAATGGVGIAATQIGVPLQVTVFGFQHSTRYSQASPVAHTVLINPQVEFIGEEINEDWEGCLSLRKDHALRGLVPRYTHLRYSGYDQLGNFFERTVSGFHARLIQHETDHLQGLLFIQRIKDLRYFGFESELKQLMAELGSKLA